MRLKLVYFSFPYSENPRGTAKEVALHASDIYSFREDIILLIPHFVFDIIYDFPPGESHPEILVKEFELISRCDAVCYVPDRISTGVQWELAFARWLGIPVYTVEQLINKVDLEVEGNEEG
ncbi:hypothetical protein J7L13_00845 [bacterium]|nr:hypothetical protein [bacterium]